MGPDPVAQVGEIISPVTVPGTDVNWRANFFKIAVKTSNPHNISWSAVKSDIPDFHLPAYFGNLIFR